MQKRGWNANWIAAAFLYAALSLPPLFFGSRNPTVVATWCAVLGVGLAVASPKRLERPQLIALSVIAFIVACFAVVIFLQTSRLPWLVTPNPIWAEASKVLEEPLEGTVSIVRGEPWYALGAPLANALALTLGLVLGNNRVRAKRCIRVAACAGAAYALYGIMVQLFDPTQILWREKLGDPTALTATFGSHNTAASYFGSCSVIWMVLLLATVRMNLLSTTYNVDSLTSVVTGIVSRRAVVELLAFLACASALFMTASRGGILISIAVLSLTLLVYLARHANIKIACLMLVPFLIGIWAFSHISGGGVHNRISIQGLLDDEGRLGAYRSTLRMIAANPWLGTGLGTFPFAFPAYRVDGLSMNFVWDLAHNTHLQFAAEMGIPLTLIVGCACVVTTIVLVRGFLASSHDTIIPLSALMVALIGLLHSAIDFSLQISGYSIVVFALSGVGLSQSLVARSVPKSLGM